MDSRVLQQIRLRQQLSLTSQSGQIGNRIKQTTTEQAQEVCAGIRACIAEIYDEATAEAIRIQYGGSVNPATAPDLFVQNDIDGGLVGGASLKADFGKIVNYK